LTDELVLYRKVRVCYKSGNVRDLILSQAEIMSFSTALATIDELKAQSMGGFTLWYDMDLPEEHRKLSMFIVLDTVESLDIGDTDYTLDQLKNIDMEQFNIWKSDKKEELVKPIRKKRRKKKVVKVVKKKAVKKKIIKKENGFLSGLKESYKDFRGKKK
jgi:hypothetical protein